MSDEKSQEQILDELNSLEIPGTTNPWEAKQDRYTNTILGEQAGTDFSQQALSNIIRRDKNRLDNVQNRTTLVIATSPLSSYEELKYALATPQENNKAPKTQIQKVYTRNAESRTFFLPPPWAYKDNPMGAYQASLMKDLHTTAIQTSPEGEKAKVGEFFDQLYDDETQETAKLLKKVKTGFTNFPPIASSSQVWITKGGTLFVDTPQDPAGLKDSGTTLGGANLEQLKKEGTLVEEVIKHWQPKYNPCAVMAGTKQRPTNKIGKNRNVAAKSTKKISEGSDFGPRFSPLTGKPLFHAGQDLSVSAGYPIVAIADGTVHKILMDKTYGTKGEEQPVTDAMCLLSIKHDLPAVLQNQGIEVHSTYMHLLKIALKADSSGRLQTGNVVKAGQVIGFMGGGEGWPGAGGTTGPHLHFEMGVRKKDGKEGWKYDKYLTEPPLTNGGKMKYGAVDPIHFQYPNLAKFSKEALPEIQSYIPKKPEQKKKEDEAAADKAAADKE